MLKTRPEQIEIKGKTLKCLICKHTEFHTKDVLLKTDLALFFNFDWASPSVTCVICDNCGYIHWFFPVN